MKTWRFDRKITINEPVRTKDATGQEVVVWTAKYSNIWAAVDNKGGKEGYEANKLTATNEVLFTVRFRAITADMQVVYDGDTYDITSVGELEKNRIIQLKAIKKDSQ